MAEYLDVWRDGAWVRSPCHSLQFHVDDPGFADRSLARPRQDPLHRSVEGTLHFEQAGTTIDLIICGPEADARAVVERLAAALGPQPAQAVRAFFAAHDPPA